MPHKLVPTDSLSIQEGYDTIRTDKERKQNVKDVVAQMQQAGDEPTRFPIRYVKSGSDKFTRNHSTLLAALERKWPQVYAIELPYEAGSIEDMADLIVSNNGGHPVSRVRQGELYNRMTAGELKPDLVNGSEINPETDYIRKPMTDEEIGAAFTPVYTSSHIGQCRLLADSSPEVRELIESDQVALNIVVTAKQWAKEDEAKQLRILKAAIKAAREDGKDKATKKHLDAVKGDFVKLKAAGGKEKPAETSNAAPNESQEASEEASDTNAAETPTEGATDEAENLFKQASVEVLEEGSKKNKKLLGALKTFFLEPIEDVEMTLTEEEAETLAGKVIEIVKNAEAVF